MNDELAAVLERFVYDNPELEQLEAVLADFNPFVALRWTRQEIRHSAFLRWLLDPSETHGLGPYFLRIFLKRLARESAMSSAEAPSVFDVDGWDFSRAQVHQEWQSIDLLVRDDATGLVVAIENKIDTSEHSQQLQRYRALIEKQFPKHRKLFAYLTVGGDPPSDDVYVPVGHGEIADLIDETVRRRGDQLGPDVRSFLEHYVEMVRRHILEDSQIQEICRQIYENHRQALDVLFEHRPDRALEVTEFLHGLVEPHEDLLPEHSTKGFVRFIPRSLDFIPSVGTGWPPSKRVLLFELENDAGNIAVKVQLGPGDPDVRAKIHAAILAHPKIFSRAAQKLYPKWWAGHAERWITQKQYEEIELEELKSLLEERFERFRTEDLPRMVAVLEDLSDEFGSERGATETE